jgi:hypothetical protein
MGKRLCKCLPHEARAVGRNRELDCGHRCPLATTSTPDLRDSVWLAIRSLNDDLANLQHRCDVGVVRNVA